jgi:two-component system, NtrC family, sensor histidine kinase HydH
MKTNTKIAVVVLITLGTLSIHYYNLIFAGILGHSHLMHVIHGRLCYIPIVLTAIWFGLRGGLLTASVISAFSILYIYVQPADMPHDIYGEVTEIAFYLAIGVFSGILLDSERSSRNKKEEAERRLQQAEKLSSIGQMVASIAHEIKNPLGSIKGAVQILKDDTTPENDKKEFTGIIEKEVDRLDTVVRGYLSFSKPVSTALVEIDLNVILDTTIKQMRFECNDNNIDLVFSPVAIPKIKGDPDKLHQLFLNILLNSMQAMSRGGKIEINCRKIVDSGRNWVEVRIKDDGQGIPSENLKRIFEPFFSTKTQGTGLGLATVKAIVDEHLGAIRAESEIGKGTTFIIAFPVSGGDR